MERGAFYTGKYRNMFAEIGISEEQINKKIDNAFNQMFLILKRKYILKWVKIWDILLIPEIMMFVQKA